MKWAGGKNLQAQGKVREFYFESGKIDILKKSQGKNEIFGVPVISTIIFLNEEGKFVEKLSIVMNKYEIWL